MTMHGALHPKSDIDRVYLSKEMGGRGLISCEGCMWMEENNLGWYVWNSVEPLIEGVKAAETIEYNNTVNMKEFKQSWMREKKNYGKTKECMGSLQVKCQKQQKKTWYCLRKADLKVETEVCCVLRKNRQFG